MSLVAAIFVVSSLAHSATYKCKDAHGNWTEAACTGAAAPPQKIEPTETATPSPSNDAPSASADAPRTPNESETDVGAFCADRWKNDFRAQKTCIVEQGNAAERMNAKIAGIKGNGDLEQIVVACSQKWANPFGYDFTMIENCWKTQKASYDRRHQ